MSQNEPSYEIVNDLPGVSDYLRLRMAGGLSGFTEEAASLGLAGTIFGVSVRCGDEIVGMGRIAGDGGCFFQVVDVVVIPEHQGRGLGKRIMSALTKYMGEKLPRSAYVSLLADVPANALYERFGFRETAPQSVGMAKRI